MARKEAVLLARCAYQRMLEDFPSAKDCINTAMLVELVEKQGAHDPKTRHKLDFSRVCVCRKNEKSPLVWTNAELRNGAPRYE